MKAHTTFKGKRLVKFGIGRLAINGIRFHHENS